MPRVLPNKNPFGWRPTVMAIFGLALLTRGVFILTLQDGFYFPDSVDYSRAAVNLLAHGEFGESYQRSPVYPLFLAAIYALLGQEIMAVRLVEALLGAGVAVVMALMARRIGGEEVGALAGLLWSIYPLGIFIAGLVYPTSVVILLLTCAVLCLLAQARQELSLGRVVLGGILLGLTALTVPVALVTAIATAVWMAYWQPARRLLLAPLFLLGVALPLAPWAAHNSYLYDSVAVVESHLVEHLPSVDDTDKGAEGSTGEERITAILENPGALARHFVREFGHFWELYPQRINMTHPSFRAKMHAEDARIVSETVFDTSWTSAINSLSTGPVFLFALIGAGAMAAQKARRRALSLLCVTILSFAVSYSFFYGKTRYRLPIEPYVIILSAYGLRRIWLALARGSMPDAGPVGEEV
jgi:4-amino-4-deoxy-L-arabinose transferase-like glycosyltransferase